MFTKRRLSFPGERGGPRRGEVPLGGSKPPLVDDEPSFGERVQEGRRIERTLGRVDTGRPAVRDEVRRDGGHGAGDRRRGGPADLLDGEIVDERHITSIADARHPNLLDVGAAVCRPDPAAADPGRREPPWRYLDTVHPERPVVIEPQLEEDLDPSRLVRWIPHLEHDIANMDGARDGDRLGVRDDVDLLL